MTTPADEGIAAARKEARARMTFEEFVASKVRVENINNVAGLDEDDDPCPGYVYAPTFKGDTVVGGFWIANDETKAHKFQLFVIQDEWEDDDIAKLERILWDEFAQAELHQP